MDEELLSQKIVTCSKVMDVQSAKQFYSLGEMSLLQTLKKAAVDIGVEIKEIVCSDYRLVGLMRLLGQFGLFHLSDLMRLSGHFGLVNLSRLSGLTHTINDLRRRLG